MPRRSNPFDDIERMLERMNQQFQHEFGAGEEASGRGIAVDVEDREGEYVVTADVPGFERDDLSVELDDESLRIEAEHEEESERGDEGYVRRERRHRSLRRSVSVPGPVDESGVHASYSNGVLTVTLPKRGGEDGGHRIDIE
ncbi:MAG: Hsp20/alpha crystallin family protein [Halobacteriaceae archaeon]